jgi:hypothetical protein
MTPTRFAVASTLAFLPLVASAYDGPVHFEAGLGLSTYQHMMNGIWYQQGLPWTMDDAVPSVTVGLTGDIWKHGNFTLKYHLNYIFAGHVASHAWATSDENYSTTQHRCINGCDPLALFEGSGNNQGFALTLQPTYRVGTADIGIEAGPYYNRTTWHESVTQTVPSYGHVDVSYNAAWKLGWLVGVNLTVKDTTLSYRYLWNKSQFNSTNQYPAIWSNTHILTMTKVF